eukprot:365858-Chlamydomonas_euryale.AAC.4
MESCWPSCLPMRPGAAAAARAVDPAVSLCGSPIREAPVLMLAQDDAVLAPSVGRRMPASGGVEW